MLICYNALPLLCDHALDFSKEKYKNDWGLDRLHDLPDLDPLTVRSGDVVFVKTDFIEDGHFLNNFLNKICSSFVLVTGNSSYQIGQLSSHYKTIVQDPRVMKWFCVNPPSDYSLYPKISPLPIGFEEPSRMGGDQGILEKFYQEEVQNKESYLFLPYHTPGTNSQRQKIINLLKSNAFVKCNEERKQFVDYLEEMKKYRFILCLEGSGFDTHRIYETYLVNSIPIIKKSVASYLLLYYNLPFIEVNSWDEITTEWFNNLKTKEFDYSSVKSFLNLESLKNKVRGVF